MDFQTISDCWYEYHLEDGTIAKLRIDMNSISHAIDPVTNKPMVNPHTGEPILNLNWTARAVISYSDKALSEAKEWQKK